MFEFNIFVSFLMIFMLYIKKCDAEPIKINIFPKEIKHTNALVQECRNGQEYYCTDLTHFRRCDSKNVPVSKEASRFDVRTTYVCHENRCCVPNRKAPCSLKCPKSKQVKLGKTYNGVRQSFEVPVRIRRTPSEKEFVTRRKYKFNYNDLINLSKRKNTENHGKNCYHKIHKQEFNISTIDYDVVNYLETILLGEDALSQDNLLWEIDELINELDDQLKKHNEDVNRLKSKGDKRCDGEQNISEGNLCVNEGNTKDEFGMDDARNLPHIVKIIKNFLTGANYTSINESIIAINYTVFNGIPGMEIEVKDNVPTTNSEYPVNLNNKKYNKLMTMLEIIQYVYEQILIKKEVNIDDKEGMFTWFSNSDIPVSSEDELEYDNLKDKDKWNEDKNDKINQDHQANTDKKNKYNGVDDILVDESQNVKKEVTRRLKPLRNIEKREITFFDNTDEPEISPEYMKDGKQGMFTWLSNAGTPVVSEDNNDKINQDHQANIDKKNKYNEVDDILVDESQSLDNVDEDVNKTPKPLGNIEKREVTFLNNTDKLETTEYIQDEDKETSKNKNPLGDLMLKTNIKMINPQDPVVLIIGRSRNLTADSIPEEIGNSEPTESNIDTDVDEVTTESIKTTSNSFENNSNITKFVDENIPDTTSVLEDNANQFSSEQNENRISTIDKEIDYRALYEALVNSLFKIVEEHAKITKQLFDTLEIESDEIEPDEFDSDEFEYDEFEPYDEEETLDVITTTYATPDLIDIDSSPTELSNYQYNLYNTTSFNSSSKKFKEFKDDRNISKRNITQYIQESNKTTEIRKRFPNQSSFKKLFDADLVNNNNESFDMNKYQSPEDFLSGDEDMEPDELYTKTVVRNKTISKNLVEDDFEKAGNRTLVTIEKETIANKKTNDGNVVTHDVVNEASNHFFIREIRRVESKKRIENDEETFEDFD